MYGEVNAITYAHPTLETNRNDRITWFDASATSGDTQAKNRVMSAQLKPDQTVEKEVIMRLQLTETAPAQVVDQLWVFNAFVVARLTDQTILFYEKPLLMKGLEPPMTLNLGENTIQADLLSVNFGRDPDNESGAVMFGISAGKVHRYLFSVDLELKTVALTGAIEVEFPQFD